VARVTEKSIGTEKQQFSASLREEGNRARQEIRQGEKVRVATQQSALDTKRTASLHGEQMIKAGKELPPAIQRSQGELHSQAAVTQNKRAAGEQFLKARDASRELRHLSTKAPENTASASKIATHEGIVQKPQVADAGALKQNGQQLLQGAHAARQAQPATKKGEAKPEAHRAKTSDRSAARKTKHPEGQAEHADPVKTAAQLDAGVKQAAPGASQQAFANAHVKVEQGEPGGLHDGADEKDAVEEKSQHPQSSIYKSGQTNGQRASSGLSTLLGGSTGGGADAQAGGEGGGAFDARAARIEGKELPEKYEHLKVYSEFDDNVFGPADLASKAMVFKSGVVQNKLENIARLNSDLDGRLKDMFKRPSFKERFGNDVKLADALKGVYGGING
jgi:hypothetical protein